MEIDGETSRVELGWQKDGGRKTSFFVLNQNGRIKTADAGENI